MRSLTDRAKRLREESLSAVERISAERASLVTIFYAGGEAAGLTAPMLRARTFEFILRHKRLYIGDDELIVGERGPEPKATPTYPEISLHSPEDLVTLDRREKVGFGVDEEVRKVYSEEVLPFWRGRSSRERIMSLMTPEWHRAYEAGLFTEFQEQRAPGHTVLGGKMFQTGFLDLKREIADAIARLDFEADAEAFNRLEELRAMEVVCDAIIMFAGRYAAELESMASSTENRERQEELKKMAKICRKVPAHAPETFHEALQHYWFIHVGVITELNPWDSFNPGRLDQHLLPFYEGDLQEVRLTDEEAFELLCCFWVKFNNHPAPPKMGVTASESSTYTDFTLINVGGVKEDGIDGVNAMSYMLLDVIREMRLLQPGSMVQISRKNPDLFIMKALEIVRSGFGQPSFFNTEALIQQMLRQGKSIEDARNGGASGCVETGAFGKEAYWLTGYFNLPKILELTLNNGYDERTGVQVGLPLGSAGSFETFNQLIEAYRKQVEYFIDIKIRGNNVIEGVFGNYLPVPFLSVLIDGCIDNGRDYNCGGARYNTSYIQGVGVGTVTDILTSIRHNIYEIKRYGWEEVLAALKADYDSYESMQYDFIYNTPHYGNDDDYADRHAAEVFGIFHGAVDGRRTLRGGVYRINLLPTTSHVYFGSVLGATPDGRRSGTPVSEGISPVQGADSGGPTAVIRSAAKIDHLRTGGTLLNQKFSPQFFENSTSIAKVMSLIRGYFSMDGHHIQFNVVDAETLKRARKNPELYRDLIVRVAGYSDYFNDLGDDLQEEIIKRTEHEGV